MRGRRWVLSAHAVAVDTTLEPSGGGLPVALANAFTTQGVGIAAGGGVEVNATAFIVAVTYAPQFGRVKLSLRGVDGILWCASTSLVWRVVAPGDVVDNDGRALPGSHAADSCTNTPHGGPSADTIGCAAVQSVNHNVTSSTTVVVMQFGSSPVIDPTAAFNNAALVILQCPPRR
jgi:hypothetical protein